MGFQGLLEGLMGPEHQAMRAVGGGGSNLLIDLSRREQQNRFRVRRIQPVDFSKGLRV